MIDLKLIQDAVNLASSGKFEEAEKRFLELLDMEPDNYYVLSSLGLFYTSRKLYDNACVYLEKAYNIKKTAGTVSALGFCEYKKSNYQKAAAILEEALTYGETEDIYNKLVLSLFKTEDYTKAIGYAEKMYQKYPQSPNSVANMIKAMTHSERIREAEVLCVEYLKEHPDTPDLWTHLGLLKELIYHDDKQAYECYKAALDLGMLGAYYNMGVSLYKQKDFKNAEINLKKMLEICPGEKESEIVLALCYLTQKRFKEGYNLFFKRDTGFYDDVLRNHWAPGKEFENEVTVLCEQGYGDHLQFSRYLPFLKEKTGKIYLAAPTPLKELFKNNFPYCEIIDKKDANPEIQVIRITDLAYALDMDFDHIPSSGGYLNAPRAEITSNKPKVGLCWEAGSAAIRTMLNRTINIRLFERILNLENIQLYSFQVQDTLSGNEKYPQMINLAKDFKNFYDTAQAVKTMDLMLCVDTSVTHLAGALGVKTFLLLPEVTDWRWFDDTKTTPWYDSVEIFKQTDPVSWEEQFEEITCRLKEFSL